MFALNTLWLADLFFMGVILRLLTAMLGLNKLSKLQSWVEFFSLLKEEVTNKYVWGEARMNSVVWD